MESKCWNIPLKTANANGMRFRYVCECGLENEVDALPAWHNPGMTGMQHEEIVKRLLEATKIIDGLMVLFRLYDEDYAIIDDALDFLAEIKKEYPDHPVTVRIAWIIEGR